MKGKTVVITGGTSGIGEIAAERLAQMGARIVLIARDKCRGTVILARLHERAPGLGHTVYYADLARIPEMKRVAAEIASQETRIDLLINNAGAMFANRRFTDDGLECTFALNHMAYFVITEGLRERLLASAPARIVNTASAAHQGARLDFDDLQLAKGFGPMKAYSRSKLCNILFTRELAYRLLGTGVTANCLHPGFVATRFGDQSDHQRKVARISHQVIDALGWLADETLAADCLTVLEPRRDVDGRGGSRRGFRLAKHITQRSTHGLAGNFEQALIGHIHVQDNEHRAT